MHLKPVTATFFLHPRLPMKQDKYSCNKVFFNRVLTNVYEAASIYKQEKCQESKKDYMPLWYLYSIVACNLLLVRLSVNKPKSLRRWKKSNSMLFLAFFLLTNFYITASFTAIQRSKKLMLNLKTTIAFEKVGIDLKCTGPLAILFIS
jgi:hypothetical protein